MTAQELPRPSIIAGAVLLLAFALAGFAACAKQREIVIGRESWPTPGRMPTPGLLDFTATAYAVSGETASGAQTRRGVVAADPSVLPLGSRIRVHGAGAYSGEYQVSDTGAKVTGRTIDIYMHSAAEARRFGRRSVQVEVLEKASPSSR